MFVPISNFMLKVLNVILETSKNLRNWSMVPLNKTTVCNDFEFLSKHKVDWTLKESTSRHHIDLFPNIVKGPISVNVISPCLTSQQSKLNLILVKSLTIERYNLWTSKRRLSVHCSGGRLYDQWFFPIFSFKQTRGGSYHRSYKLDKERVSLSPRIYHSIVHHHKKLLF